MTESSTRMQYNKLMAIPYDKSQYRSVVLEKSRLPPCSECEKLRYENARLRMALEKIGYRDPTWVSNRNTAGPILKKEVTSGNDPKQIADPGKRRTARELSPMTNARVTDWETIWAGTPDVISARAQPRQLITKPTQAVGENTDALYKEISRLTKELEYKDAEVQMYRRRLGEATPITGNDVFSSAGNRPNKEQVTSDKDIVTKRYSDLFEKEWKTSLQVLEGYGLEYRESTDLLLSILREVYRGSGQMCIEQLDDIVEGTNVILTERTNGKPLSKYDIKEIGGDEAVIYRKKVADKTAVAITKIFPIENVEALQNASKAIKNNKTIREYVNRCIEVTWSLCVQDPPMVIEVTQKKGQAIDQSLYQCFKTEGTVFDTAVWPLLRSKKNGAVLMKGWVDAKEKKQSKK